MQQPYSASAHDAVRCSSFTSHGVPISIDTCVAAVAPFVAFVLFVVLPDFYVRNAASQVKAPSHKRACIQSVCRHHFVPASASPSHLASLFLLDRPASVLLGTLQVTSQCLALDSFTTSNMLPFVFVSSYYSFRHFTLQLQRNACAPSLTYSPSLCRTPSHQSFWAKSAPQYCVLPFSYPLLRVHVFNMTLSRQRHLQPSLSNAFVRAHPLHSPSSVLWSRLPALL